MRRACGLALVLALAGCGKGETGPIARGPAKSPAQAARCLSRAGFRTTHGPPGPGDRDAPDFEVTAFKGAYPRGTGLFVAYYADALRANRLAPSIRRNARRFHGLLERYGRISFVWTRPPSAEARAQVARCVF
jgi:hypothetical protein